MPKTIYVVQGSTGEFSDHREWLVKAFVSEERARELVVKASARAREIQQWMQDDDTCAWYDKTLPSCQHNRYDPLMSDEDNGGGLGTSWNYTVIAVELDEE